jgi:hypothetical protein
MRDARIEDQTYLGEPSDTHQHVGFAYAGVFNLEIIQPLSGVSTYSKFLDATRAGESTTSVSRFPTSSAPSGWP